MDRGSRGRRRVLIRRTRCVSLSHAAWDRSLQASCRLIDVLIVAVALADAADDALGTEPLSRCRLDLTVRARRAKPRQFGHDND